jgi:hypothetical protein
VDEGEHDGDVAVGAAGKPSGVEIGARVVADRANVDDIDPRVPDGAIVLGRIVVGDAAGVDLHVAAIRAAEIDDPLTVLDEISSVVGASIAAA